MEDALGPSGHVQAFVDAAERLAKPGETIAVVVNRVKLARAVRERLAERHHAILLTGRVRPLERDRLIEEYRSRLFSGRRPESEETRFSSSPPSASRPGGPRFRRDGHADRAARLPAPAVRPARSARIARPDRRPPVIAARDEVAKSAKPDPIYGDRARKTWEWLLSKAREPAKGENKRLNLGPDAMAELIAPDPEGARGCAAAAKTRPSCARRMSRSSR